MKKITIIVISLILGIIITSCGYDDNIKRNSYTVTFNSQGGTLVESQNVLQGNSVRRPETPIRDGYFLNGWYTSSNTTEESEWDFDFDRVDSDITLYAGWTVDTSTEPTTSLVYKQEGNAYTVIDIDGEETVVIIPAEYNGLPVTKIQGEYGTGAFARTAITSVTIPDTIIEIGQNSFNNCSNLKTINISTQSSLTSIGNNAFSGNSSLEEIYLPTGMVNLGDNVFNNCGSLNRFIVAEDNPNYQDDNGHLIEIATMTLLRGANNSIVPHGVKIIAQAAFRRAKITELQLPNTIEKIENYIIQDSSIEKLIYLNNEENWLTIEKANLWNMGKTDISIEYRIQESEEITVMYITIYNNKLEVVLENNSSVDALLEILKKGDIVYTAEDYNNMEKVGDIKVNLPTNNTQISSQPGDVILYQGHQIVIFYGNNSWSYTKIGRINGYSQSELRDLLGAGRGSTTVRISLK